MTDMKRLQAIALRVRLAGSLYGAQQVLAEELADYESAIGWLERLIDRIDNGSISFEDDTMRESLMMVSAARACVRHLRDGVPA